jgi:hypothetical protein
VALSVAARRRLVCKYAGVELQVAADLERIDPAELAHARRSLGRSIEDGNPGSAPRPPAAPAREREREDTERLMRANRSAL